MYLLTRLRLQTFRQYRLDEPGCRSVVQNAWRFLRQQAEFDVHRVTLSRTNALTVGRQGKSLLVAGFDDVQQCFAAERRSGQFALGNQRVDGSPTLRVQDQIDGIGLVAQNEAQKLAELNWIESHGRRGTDVRVSIICSTGAKNVRQSLQLIASIRAGSSTTRPRRR